MKESRKPAVKQSYNDVKGKTPENFIKQLDISGRDSTNDSKFMDPNKKPDPKIRVRGGGSLR